MQAGVAALCAVAVLCISVRGMESSDRLPPLRNLRRITLPAALASSPPRGQATGARAARLVPAPPQGSSVSRQGSGLPPMPPRGQATGTRAAPLVSTPPQGSRAAPSAQPQLSVSPQGSRTAPLTPTPPGQPPSVSSRPRGLARGPRAPLVWRRGDAVPAWSPAVEAGLLAAGVKVSTEDALGLGMRLLQALTVEFKAWSERHAELEQARGCLGDDVTLGGEGGRVAQLKAAVNEAEKQRSEVGIGGGMSEAQWADLDKRPEDGLRTLKREHRLLLLLDQDIEHSLAGAQYYNRAKMFQLDRTNKAREHRQRQAPQEQAEGRAEEAPSLPVAEVTLTFPPSGGDEGPRQVVWYYPLAPLAPSSPAPALAPDVMARTLAPEARNYRAGVALYPVLENCDSAGKTYDWLHRGLYTTSPDVGRQRLSPPQSIAMQQRGKSDREKREIERKRDTRNGGRADSQRREARCGYDVKHLAEWPSVLDSAEAAPFSLTGLLHPLPKPLEKVFVTRPPPRPTPRLRTELMATSTARTPERPPQVPAPRGMPPACQHMPDQAYWRRLGRVLDDFYGDPAARGEWGAASSHVTLGGQVAQLYGANPRGSPAYELFQLLVTYRSKDGDAGRRNTREV